MSKAFVFSKARLGTIKPSMAYAGQDLATWQKAARVKLRKLLAVAKAARKWGPDKAFRAFANDPLVDLPVKKARTHFDETAEDTKAYLQEYFR